MEKLAEISGLDRTAIGLIERGERDPLLTTALAISAALGVGLQDLLTGSSAPRIPTGRLVQEPEIPKISARAILDALSTTYSVLDTIDDALEQSGSPKLARLVETANLSAFVGNLFAGALARSSGGVWERNRPHTHPDLVPPGGQTKVSAKKSVEGVEVKVALDTNGPKGHLPKANWYITMRYVLVDSSKAGSWKSSDDRGDTVVVWEVKADRLEREDFAFSSTVGDSGKTAPIKTAAFNEMTVVYFDEKYLPYASLSRYVRQNRIPVPTQSTLGPPKKLDEGSS